MNYPSATYRIQLNSEFTFKQLAEIIDYLYALGISTIYAAPITMSRKNSSHGYDVIDPSVINPQIGTLEELRDLRTRLQRYGMNWLQDIVPNHMSLSSDNTRLMDVLERGSDSPYYNYFDIDWQHKEAAGKLWIPVLGNDWQDCLEAGEFRINFNEQKGFEFYYHDHHFPLAVSAIREMLSCMRETNTSQGLSFVIEDLMKGAQRKELATWKKHKEKYIGEISAQFIHDVQQALLIINKDKSKLNKILQAQPYLLTYWETSERQMNYRRFFAINDLICLRIEDKNVFEDYHAFFHFLYKEDLIQGVRLDHIDGLYHPLEYTKRLRKKMGDDCYIIVEKILEYNEDIASDWDIQGTSGYEFLSFSNRVLTDQEGAEKLRQFYHAFTLWNTSYGELVFQNKHNFLYSQMLGELDNLMDLLVSLGLTEQVTLEQRRIKKALGLFMSAFPIYRIYPFMFPIADEALQFVNKAYDVACDQDNTYKPELTFIRSLFHEDQPDKLENKMKFVMRLMQFTGPLAAKGVEDTTFYVYNPLISHNEVGDSPEELACTTAEFHEKMISRQVNNPFSLNGSSTHDTKRGEDARARLNVLSHLHHEWEGLVMQWHEENKKFTQTINNKRCPSLNDEYYIYQSLLGSFPENDKIDELFIERTKQFMLKALREAKVETSYTENNERYESSCLNFISSILDASHSYFHSFLPFLEKVNRYAAIYSLVQTVIKITAPGIPDIYQGSELWELSYVDPDNRRKVDYACRKQFLQETHRNSSEINWLKDRRKEGIEKLFVTTKLLHLRKDNPDIFIHGEYIPLAVYGKEGRCIAYLRKKGDETVLILLPIGFNVNEAGGFTTTWEDVFIKLPDGLSSKWRNVFTGHTKHLEGTVAVAEVFMDFPVGVYTSAS
ncbi:MAG: treC [Chitinophagaceae bacterium]|nr:treC [Chitinophagaceae bacterium]